MAHLKSINAQQAKTTDAYKNMKEKLHRINATTQEVLLHL
jgi:hypothetical protein